MRQKGWEAWFGSSQKLPWPLKVCCGLPVCVQSSVRLSRLSRAATSQVMESLEPLHDELALAPVSRWRMRLERLLLQRGLFGPHPPPHPLWDRRRGVGGCAEFLPRRASLDMLNADEVKLQDSLMRALSVL